MYQQRLELIKLKQKNPKNINSRIFGTTDNISKNKQNCFKPTSIEIYDAIERSDQRTICGCIFDKAASFGNYSGLILDIDYSEFVWKKLGIEDNKLKETKKMMK